MLNGAFSAAFALAAVAQYIPDKKEDTDSQDKN